MMIIYVLLIAEKWQNETVDLMSQLSTITNNGDDKEEYAILYNKQRVVSEIHDNDRVK